MGSINRPELLDKIHDIADFDCGNETLNDWLKKRALKNQNQGANKTFVICDGKQVIGYYALATGSIERINVPKSLTRNMPNPIPIIVLGRLAIDRQSQGGKFGSALLKDAIRRTIFVSDNVGVKALLVHAISEEAKRFYVHHNFIESPIESMTLLLSMNNKKKLEDL